jgi:ribonuclease P protein component
MISNSFPKSEHLCGEKRIMRLFTDGDAFIVYPFRIVYLVEENNSLNSPSVLISVPKKRFKRAVKRNRLKRLMREAYRLNSQPLRLELLRKERHIQVAFNYVSDEELDFATIEKKMKQALQKLIERI